MIAFAKRVRVWPSLAMTLAEGVTELVFKLPPLPYTAFYQKTIWRYRLKANGDYVFCLSKLDVFDLKVAGRVPIRSEWEASLEHESWAETFSQNYMLPMGEKSKWDPSLASFFPAGMGYDPTMRNPGFKEFVGYVNMVTKSLSKDW